MKGIKCAVIRVSGRIRIHLDEALTTDQQPREITKVHTQMSKKSGSYSDSVKLTSNFRTKWLWLQYCV